MFWIAGATMLGSFRSSFFRSSSWQDSSRRLEYDGERVPSRVACVAIRLDSRGTINSSRHTLSRTGMHRKSIDKRVRRLMQAASRKKKEKKQRRKTSRSARRGFPSHGHRYETTYALRIPKESCVQTPCRCFRAGADETDLRPGETGWRWRRTLSARDSSRKWR